MYPGAIRTPQVLNFLYHLRRQIRGKLLVIWDGLTVHRSRKVREFLGKQHGNLILAALPAYAPELNPTEYIWGYWKNHAMANLCAKDFAHLTSMARRTLKRAQKRASLVRAFWKQAELSL
jgi:transposase